jgi:ABC-2 type transport system permease protein
MNNKYLKNLYKYRFLLQEIVRKNVRLQYRDSVLGVFWTFLQPLLTTLVLVVVFGRIFGKTNSGVVSYPIYLLCGRLLFEFFSQSTKRAMHSIEDSSSVIKKVYVPKYIYPLANVISTFVTFLISLSVLFAMMAYYSLFTNVHLFYTKYDFLAFIPIVILFMLCIGVGLILSVLAVFFKDVEYLYDVFTLLLFYMTPIFYKLNQLHLNSMVNYGLMANPLYSIVSMFRACVLYGVMWNWNWFFYSLGFSILTIIIGVWTFYKNQDKFILYL